MVIKYLPLLIMGCETPKKPLQGYAVCFEKKKERKNNFSLAILMMLTYTERNIVRKDE